MSLVRNLSGQLRSLSSLARSPLIWSCSTNLLRTKNNASKPLQICAAGIHTTKPRNDLMEFFDDKKNWNKQEVRLGRAWRIEELRIKSNSDLHKLWYVLLKEQNMLKTMEHEADLQYKLFPNPERIDKVEISMSNIEKVVRERNKAYHLLETGVDGERPARMEKDTLGMKFLYQTKEYFIPKIFNRSWDVKFFDFYRQDRDLKTFLSFYREKNLMRFLKAKKAQHTYAEKLLMRFPKLNRGLLRKKYPLANMEKINAEDIPKYSDPKHLE